MGTIFWERAKRKDCPSAARRRSGACGEPVRKASRSFSVGSSLTCFGNGVAERKRLAVDAEGGAAVAIAPRLGSV